MQSRDASQSRKRASVLEAAREVGVSLGDLARHMGLSRQRVHQLANGPPQRAERVRVAIAELVKERPPEPTSTLKRIALAQTEPPPASKGVRLIDAIAAYLRSLQASDYSPFTIRTTTSSLRIMADYMGDVTVEEATSLATEFLSERAQHTRRNTLCTDHSHVKGLFHFCVRQSWLQQSPFDDVPAPRGEIVVTRPLTDEEISALLKAGNEWERAAITLLLGSGMTIGELAKLRWQDVGKGVLLLHGGGNKQRTIAPEAIAMRELMGLPREGPYVFPFSRDAMAARMRRLSLRAGVHFHPHQCRYTFAHRYLKAGGDIESLSAILGHNSLDSTATYKNRWQRRGATTPPTPYSAFSRNAIKNTKRGN